MDAKPKLLDRARAIRSNITVTEPKNSMSSGAAASFRSAPSAIHPKYLRPSIYDHYCHTPSRFGNYPRRRSLVVPYDHHVWRFLE